MGSTETKADISNWRDSPHNQWGFVNVDKVLKTDEIKKPQQAYALQSDPREFKGFTIQLKDKTFDLPGFMTASDTDGLIVLQNGKVLCEKYDRGNDHTSKHIMMSMTKSVAGLIVGILVGQGKLKEDELVTKYVPEVSGTFYKDVRIRQCLDMRSGAVYPDGDHDYRCAVGWNPENGSEKYTNLHDFIANFEPEMADDDRFEYVSVNTDLVGWIVERATGKTFAQTVQDLLWQPMGAESDALMAVDKKGHARAAGGLCATLRDIARIGQLFVDGGRGVVPSSWLGDIISGGSKDAFARGTWAAGLSGGGIFQGLAYRSYWLADEPTEIAMALGIHGQMLFADRKTGLVVAKTASQPDSVDFVKVRMTVLAFMEFQRLVAA